MLSIKMWLANTLTVSRIPLAAAFWLTYGHRGWSVAIIVAAAVTDALDGTVARRARLRDPHASTPGVGVNPPPSISGAGEWLDPLADKIFVFAVVAAIALYEPTRWYVVAATCAREVIVVPMAIVFRIVRPHAAHAYKADPIGKATTIAQLATMVGLVARVPGVELLAYATGALGIAAVVHYIARDARLHAPV